MAKDFPKQADLAAQEALVEVTSAKKTVVTLSNGKEVKVGFLLPDTQDKLDELLVEHNKIANGVKDGKISVYHGNKKTRQMYAKAVAAILINNHWGLKLWWWAKWRIIYHYWNIDGEDFVSIIGEAKKKVAEQQFYLGMALMTSMGDIWTIMTRKEAEAFRRELSSGKEQQ